MPTRQKNPVNIESRFDVEELFFSTTDQTGRIRSGNSIFQRVAGYSLGGMLGQPHSLVRHRDMPRAVFALLWKYLSADRPIAAYVKNVSADGSYYWVMASAVSIPGEEGFLSVRLKPTSDLFPVAQKLYAGLLEIEQEYEARGDRRGGLEASVAELPRLLEALGFASYDEFMHLALSTEVGVRSHQMEFAATDPSDGPASRPVGGPLEEIYDRCQHIDKLLRRQYSQLDKFIALSSTLDEKSRFVSALAKTVRLVSLNAIAASGRLSTAGAPLGVIAQTVGVQAEQSGVLAQELQSRNDRAKNALRRTAFFLSLAKLQMEMLTVFLSELIAEASAGASVGAMEVGAVAEGLESLVRCLTSGVKDFFSSYAAVMDELQPLMSDLSQLHRLVQTLDITHVTGRVESGRLAEGKRFDALFAQIGGQVNQARAELKEFAAAVSGTLDEIGTLVQVEPEILKHLQAVDTASCSLKKAA